MDDFLPMTSDLDSGHLKYLLDHHNPSDGENYSKAHSIHLLHNRFVFQRGCHPSTLSYDWQKSFPIGSLSKHIKEEVYFAWGFLNFF